MDATDDHFSLKWNNFRSSLTEGFHNFLQEEMMVDVTLAVEGKFLQAHKLVLSVCSPYFKNLFSINPCKHPIVILKDVTHHELSYVLEFMYKGEVGVKHEELPSFLKLADTLMLKGLAGVKVEDARTSLCASDELSSITQVRKKSSELSKNFDAAKSLTESGSCTLKEMRPPRQRKRRHSNPPKTDSCKLVESKKLKQTRSDQDSDYYNNGEDDYYNNDGNDDDGYVADDCESDALVKLIVKDKSTEPSVPRLNSDNVFDSEELEEDRTSADECDLRSSYFDSSTDAEQAPQGGVDYQMIQTKRGKDMLLYDGYTFTQNRMCKDGMRWQCSFNKCKAFCRMSSAGWLTPFKTNHEHPKPSEEEIKKRILRMELKARAQSSGATPGEIIRNALPAEEYQTTDQRACYTRCIQRFRKSLQRKNSKPPEEACRTTQGLVEKDALKPGNPPTEDSSSLSQPLPLSDKEGLKEEPIWTAHQEPIQLSDGKDQLVKKNDLHHEIGPFGI